MCALVIRRNRSGIARFDDLSALLAGTCHRATPTEKMPRSRLIEDTEVLTCVRACVRAFYLFLHRVNSRCDKCPRSLSPLFLQSTRGGDSTSQHPSDAPGKERSESSAMSREAHMDASPTSHPSPGNEVAIFLSYILCTSLSIPICSLSSSSRFSSTFLQRLTDERLSDVEYGFRIIVSVPKNSIHIRSCADRIITNFECSKYTDKDRFQRVHASKQETLGPQICIVKVQDVANVWAHSL